MKNFIFIFFTCFLGFSQAPPIQWVKCIGTSGPQISYSIKNTSDNGFIIAGRSGAYNYYDYLIIKTDSLGNVIWQNTFGDAGNNILYDVQQTPDGGYIALGNSTQNSNGAGTNKGVVVLKLDAAGVVQWETFFNGSVQDANYANGGELVQTQDGGYAVVAKGALTTGMDSNFLLTKLNGLGEISWQKEFGGTYYDVPTSVKQTTDGGYIMAGYTISNNGDVVGGVHVGGLDDFWIVKVNNTGTLEWQKTIGSNGVDRANSIQQTSDGGYIVAGFANSNGGDVSGVYGNADFWIAKLSSIGAIQWQKAFGGDSGDYAFEIIKTADLGYIVSGYTTSNNSGFATGSQGGYDAWVVKINALGNLQWQKRVGGTAEDSSNSITESSDGGFVMAGSTTSINFINGNAIVNNGNYDVLLLKFTTENLSSDIFNQNELVLYPNPTQDFLYLKSSSNIIFDKFEIIDTTGKVLIQQKNNGNIIDVQTLENGVYFIYSYSNGNKFLNKFIKN